QGQPLTTTFMDYLVPTAMEMPEATIVKILEETPTPLNPLGVKGVGEGGSSGVGAAIANAVADALAPFGVAIRELPLSPGRIVGLLRAVGSHASLDPHRGDAQVPQARLAGPGARAHRRPAVEHRLRAHPADRARQAADALLDDPRRPHQEERVEVDPAYEFCREPAHAPAGRLRGPR